ncbi:hypothetical protein [Streptomyces aidingensis]|uniref:Uncharacterized protein n=1 Tax=Streptomyces aidingensis TaxID=910347 RepID=A0A1I1EA49_9ACTN|nr:hypothetical protein [Streptomyces aidingensis]SFB83981.1 hypothetical protein SAMN05421773_101213 [Streptomyces aidingensis]
MAGDGDESRHGATPGTGPEDVRRERAGHGTPGEPGGFSGIRTGAVDDWEEPAAAPARPGDARRPGRTVGGCLAGCGFTALALFFAAGAGIGLLLLALKGAGNQADRAERQAWERARGGLTEFAGHYAELLAGQDGAEPDGVAVRELAERRGGRLLELRWQGDAVRARVRFDAEYSGFGFVKGRGLVSVCGVVQGRLGAAPDGGSAAGPVWRDCAEDDGRRGGDGSGCPAEPEPGSGCWSESTDPRALAAARGHRLHGELSAAALSAALPAGGSGPAGPAGPDGLNGLAGLAAEHHGLLFGYRSGAGTAEALLLVGLLPGELDWPEAARAAGAGEERGNPLYCVALRWAEHGGSRPARGPVTSCGTDAPVPVPVPVATGRDWCRAGDDAGPPGDCWLRDGETGGWERWLPDPDPAAGDPDYWSDREPPEGWQEWPEPSGPADG